MRYLNATELFSRGGDQYFHPDDTWFSDAPEGDVVVDMDMHPEVFWNEDEKKNLLDKMYTQPHMFPLFSYDPDTDQFTTADVEDTLWARKAKRRRRINETIEVRIRVSTELKKLRLALKAIVAYQPELLALPEVADFMAMGDSIETVIARHPVEE